MTDQPPIQVREYGASGHPVILLHGGPGAPGYMAPVARHVADLYQVVESYCAGARPAIVGHSWGAMLALAYAVAHPASIGPLVLVGCGTFDLASRARRGFPAGGRVDADLRRRLERIPLDWPDPDRQMQAMADLTLPLCSYDLITTDQELVACQARAHHETWQDMLRLQAEGVYPAAFASIAVPILMLYGAADIHPGPLIRDSLTPYLPQIEYHDWDRCGHYPWLERAVRDDFFILLRDWLTRHLSTPMNWRETK
jgi:pimeloyl-ACP methyl ester carboxylesterase